MKKVKRNNNFYNETEQLVKLHSKLFNINEDEALLHILNSNDYNYKGYYDEYGNLKPDKNNHFTDKYKTAFHNTFSNESIYSGKKSQYNPLGIIGGYWDENNNFIQSDDMKKVIKYKNGGSTQFKCGGMKRVPRKKAFFGAIIGAITNSILAKNQYEDEQKRYEEQMALQKEQIKKNEMYNKLNSDIQSQLALQQNNDVYDNLRNFKCGGKIKRKRGAYGLYSSYTPFNITPLGTEQIKLNVPQTSNVYNGNNSINDFGMASGALGTVINSAASIGNYLENNLLTDQKQQHQNALSKLENDAKTRNTGSALNVNNINNARNLIANNLNNSTYNTYNTQMNELQKRRRGQLNSLYLS